MRTSGTWFTWGQSRANFWRAVGAARCGDGWLVTFDAKYFHLRPGEQRSSQQIGLVGLAGRELLSELEQPDHPGYILEHNGVALVPGGYQGLLLWKYRDGN